MKSIAANFEHFKIDLPVSFRSILWFSMGSYLSFRHYQVQGLQRDFRLQRFSELTKLKVKQLDGNQL